MYKTSVSLTNIDDIKKFVSIANEFPFEIDLVSGRYIINAKSIMGIFSLDTTRGIELEADCAEDSPFVEKVKPFLTSAE